MGRSRSLIVVYGFLADQSELPWWDTEELEAERYEDWWREVNGYKPSFDIYDQHGEYIDGITEGDPRIEAYYDEQQKWDDQHPIPFDIVYNGHYESDEVFVCAPGPKAYYQATSLTDVSRAAYVDAKTQIAFEEFALQHFPTSDAKPQWWLIPFYG